MQKGYIILEVGWEYDDSYYSTNNYGNTYEAPTEIFLNKEAAEKELLKQECESYRGTALSAYFGEDGIGEHLTCEFSELADYCKKTFNITISEDDLDFLEVPKKATDKQIEGLLKLISLRFNELHEVEIKN